MSRISPDDPVAALATAPGRGALAVVRVSGAGSIALIARLFRGRVDLDSLDGFRGAHGWIERDGERVDEVVAWVYRAPHSYTGEDMVELSCHGGPVSASRVLEAIHAEGARPAGPGEFTRRAFLNERIDLTQAEAVVDLIEARGRRAQEQALHQLEGGLSRRIRQVAAGIRDVQVQIEAHMDFGEDVPELPEASVLGAALGTARSELERLAATHAPSRRIRDGLVVALTGLPNAGKSSLMNALAGFDRAIVHEEPGTTRDVVDVRLEWAGIPVRLIDTAGIRTGAAAVEEAGIERSRRECDGADRVLWVVDASRPPGPEDLALAADLDWNRVHVVLNKIDLVEETGEWVNGHSPIAVHLTSATRGDGVSDLQLALEAELTANLDAEREAEGLWVTNERHAHEMGRALEALRRAGEVLDSGQPVELAAADLHRALEALAAITGERAGEELLQEIFSRFCIGK